MVYKIALIIELIAILVCICVLHNEKFKINGKRIAFLLGLSVSFEIMRYIKLDIFVPFVTLIFITLFCVVEYKEKVITAVFDSMMIFVLIGILQYCGAVLLSQLGHKFEEIRMLTINVVVLILLIIVDIKLINHNQQKNSIVRHKIIKIFGGFAFGIIIFMIMQSRISKKIDILLYLFSLPVIIMGIYIIIKWQKTQRENEIITKELKLSKETFGDYEELINEIRFRQHGFKNQLAALSSSKYLTGSSDEIIAKQEAYIKLLLEDNKYSTLLHIGNSIISGFVYQKLCNAEESNIGVECKVMGEFVDCSIPLIKVVEALGILLDNAIEAQYKITDNRYIRFEFSERDDSYCFNIFNKNDYIEYSTLESWFEMENSEKGKGRGLGLYYLKKLSAECQFDIICKNTQYNNENGIEMVLVINKKMN